MIAKNVLMFEVDGVLIVASVALIALAFTVWQYLYVDRRRADEDHALSDGAVLLLANGVIRQASEAAEAMLGPCVDEPARRVLGDFLGAGAAEAHEAIDRLEVTGDRVGILVRDATGQPYEMIGTPSGAMIRLVLREARLMDEMVRAADRRVRDADAALEQRDWAERTMIGLIADAPIIGWHRTAEGVINWSGGEIRTRNGSVRADQAVNLIIARTRLNRQPMLAGQPQKSRIEIVLSDGAETVALHVIEIVRPDGSRLGFATDAGTAASAERTLTRFVQTMTETFAHLTVGLAIFDRNQTLALFNPALVQMWQVEPAWLARRPSLRDIIDELRASRRLPELQDFHQWRARLVDLFENTEAADYEELWHLADGSNIRVLARPHPHGSLAFIFDDVTERMRLEQRYRHSIDLRRATLDRMSDGIAVFGANGLLQFVNQAFHQIWGTDSETVYAAMHARQLLEMCGELASMPETWRRLHGYITGGDARHAWSARVSRNAGGKLLVRVAPLPDGSTMAVFTDVTEAASIDDELSERNETLALVEAVRAAVRDRAEGDMRAPLDELVALAEEARAARGSAAARRLAARVAEAADRLARAAGEIAELASAPMAAPAPDATPVDLSEVLSFSVRLLARRAEEAGVSLTQEPVAEADRVDGEAHRLHAIVFKLVSEAIERTPSGGSVTVSASGSGATFEIVTASRVPKRRGTSDKHLPAMPTPLVQRLVGRVGGTVEIEPRPDRVLVTCRFQLVEPAPHGTRSGEAAEVEGNVRTLLPPAAR